MNNIKWDRENPYLFLEDWRRKWCKNGDWDVWHRVFESDSVEREMGKTVNNHKNSRKNTEKVLKTLFETQNTHFSWLKWVANKSPGLAAKTFKDKIVKNFLSVFCNWKIYLRGSRELSHGNLYISLTTRPFTHEQVRSEEHTSELQSPA